MASEQSFDFTIKNTLIAPSRFGLLMIAITLCLFILGTNYQNNIILYLCYVLIALLCISLFASFFFYTDHKLVVHPIKPDFENRDLFVPFELISFSDSKEGVFFLSCQDNVKRQAFTFAGIKIKFPSSEKVVNTRILKEAKNPDGKMRHKLLLPTLERGSHQCPSIKIWCYHGIGLFITWSIYKPDMTFLVYPKMQKAPLDMFESVGENEITNVHTNIGISNQLDGIRTHKETDPLHQISWKHVAKGQGLVSKNFSGSYDNVIWLKLSNYSSKEMEESLRIMSYWIHRLNRDDCQFGLDLNGSVIKPNKGVQHVNACLEALALYPASKLRAV